MAELYWTDGWNIWHWDGSTLTSNRPTGFSSSVGTLVMGPDKLLGGYGSGQSMTVMGDVTLSLASLTAWSTMTIPTTYGSAPINVTRPRDNAIGVYDAADDAYWLYIYDRNNSDYSNNSSWEHWLKCTPSGTVISTHAAEPWDWVTTPEKADGSNAILDGDYLYWTTNEAAIWRFNKSTDTTEWLNYSGLSGRRFWNVLVGQLSDGRFVFSNGGMTSPYDIYFEIVDLSSAAWAPVTSAGGALPAADVEYLAADAGAGMEAAWRNESGWAVICEDVCYFGASETADGLAVWSMDMATGAVAKVCGNPTGGGIYGMVALATGNIGQLYVNLSTDVDAPNWVSVCPDEAAGWNYYDATITSPTKLIGTDLVYRDDTAYSWGTNLTVATNYLYKIQHNVGAAQTVASSVSHGAGVAGNFQLIGFVQPGIIAAFRDTTTSGTPHISTFNADTLAMIDSVAVPSASGFSWRRYAAHDGHHNPSGSGMLTVWAYGGATNKYRSWETFIGTDGLIPAFTQTTTGINFGPNGNGVMANNTVWCGPTLIVSTGSTRGRAYDTSTRNWTAPQNIPAGCLDEHSTYFESHYIPSTEYFGADEWIPMYAGSGAAVGTGATTRYVVKMSWDGEFMQAGDTWAVPDPTTWARVYAIRLSSGKPVVLLTKAGPVVDGSSTNIVQLWYDVFDNPTIVDTYQDSAGFAMSSRPYVRVSTQGSFMMPWNTDSTHRQWQLTQSYLGHFNPSAIEASPDWTQIHHFEGGGEYSYTEHTVTWRPDSATVDAEPAFVAGNNYIPPDIVGGSPQWGDQSDSTYARVEAHARMNTNGSVAYVVPSIAMAGVPGAPFPPYLSPQLPAASKKVYAKISSEQTVPATSAGGNSTPANTWWVRLMLVDATKTYSESGWLLAFNNAMVTVTLVPGDPPVTVEATMNNFPGYYTDALQNGTLGIAVEIYPKTTSDGSGFNTAWPASYWARVYETWFEMFYYQEHLSPVWSPFHANTSTTGTPTWYTCCSHAP